MKTAKIPLPQLTEEQVKRYFASGGAMCPKCGDDLEGQEVNIEEGYAIQEMSCLNSKCGLVWEDSYILDNIRIHREKGHTDYEREQFNKRELATILAALRSIQKHGLGINDHFEKGIKPLSDKQIDALCERINQ